jgi:cytochrome b561
MIAVQKHFSPLARLLHWVMAPLILAMLFIGIGMVSTVAQTHDFLIAIHKPLGIMLLVLVIVRMCVRIRHGSPPLPADLPKLQALGALLSHYLLYALMAAMPLIGWAMLSAAGYPIVLYGGLHLPPIAPHSVYLYAVLRALHTDLALLLFCTVLVHLAAALFHGLIRRDGVFSSMAHGEPRR